MSSRLVTAYEKVMSSGWAFFTNLWVSVWKNSSTMFIVRILHIIIIHPQNMISLKDAENLEKFLKRDKTKNQDWMTVINVCKFPTPFIRGQALHVSAKQCQITHTTYGSVVEECGCYVSLTVNIQPCRFKTCCWH